MKNILLKRLIAVSFLTGISIFSFPLITQAEDECESGNCGSPVPIPTNPVASNKVTMELMLSVDVSGSINPQEYNLQKQGYINAFRNREVQDAIELLPNGLAVAIETWSSDIVKTSNWYKITNAAEARSFANVIASTLNRSQGQGSTNITKALKSASSELATNRYDGDVLVIDISGDGFDNTAINGSNSRCDYSIGTPVNQVFCRPLQAMRDNAVANGIIINGLPIVSNNPQSDRQHELAPYYKNNVIGGVNPTTGRTTTASGEPVSFIQVAQDFNGFANAIIAKIKKEILIAIEIAPPTPNPGANRKPIVINDIAKTPSGSINVNVLGNDSDPDGDSLSVSNVTNGQNGRVSIVGNTVTYTPNRGFSGTDNFTYTASDGRGGTGTATVTVTIGAEPPMPTETDVSAYPPD